MNTAGAHRPSPPVVTGWHRPLMFHVALMSLLVVVSTVGLLVDDRVLLDESIWVKPLKFGFAFAAYGATLAWLLTKLTRAKRFGWWMGTAFALFGAVDVGVVALAAANGTFSHFNGADGPVNQVVQFVFTYGVPPLLISNLIIGVLVLVQRTGDRALCRALRAGLALSSLGMAVPVMMIPMSFTAGAALTDANGDRVPMVVGHGIGDAHGTGMPLTNWSATGGDLRVPHFIGMHGIHVLLLAVLALSFLTARVPLLHDVRVRAGLVAAVATGYSGLFAVTTWQAFRGQSLIDPDASTVLALAGVGSLTAAIALVAVAFGSRRFGKASPELVTAT